MARMTKDEREKFLEELHVGVIGIEHEGGPPLVVPIWYSYEPGGEVKILTHSESLKARCIGAAARFSLCAQSETLPYKYVSVEGPITGTRAADREEDTRPLARRYLGKTMGDKYVEDGDESNSVVITMKPERWYTVDYGKTE